MANLPTTSSESNALKKLFNGAFYQSVMVDDSTYNLIYGFFLDRTGFKESADALSSTLLTLANNQKINPVDILSEFDKATSESDFKKVLIALFNNSRISTSKLGYSLNKTTNKWVDRTILP